MRWPATQWDPQEFQQELDFQRWQRRWSEMARVVVMWMEAVGRESANGG